MRIYCNYTHILSDYLNHYQVSGLEARVAELESLYKAEYEAHLTTKQQIPCLEKMISERDVQIDFLTKNVCTMEVW